ncbi:hypothetical protein [Paraburkholderia pallida]|uniref:hypothetical protein n=1 Tax=Paraburkholderia pallida TaxID=2547399 RepID=UPI00300406C8
MATLGEAWQRVPRAGRSGPLQADSRPLQAELSRIQLIHAKRSSTVSHVPRAKTVDLNQRASLGDAAAALALLEQSMARGHQRIGLLRYLRARCLGAALEGRHHDYAQRVTARLSEVALAGLAQEAQRRHLGCQEQL